MIVTDEIHANRKGHSPSLLAALGLWAAGAGPGVEWWGVCWRLGGCLGGVLHEAVLQLEELTEGEGEVWKRELLAMLLALDLQQTTVFSPRQCCHKQKEDKQDSKE